MILVDAQRVTASRPGKPLFADLSLSLSTGDRLAIVGLNGCGKSTLLRILAGSADPESGTVRRGKGVRVAVLDQDPQLPPGPVRAAVGDSWESAAVLDRLGMGSLIDAETTTLSGGQAKRVALARTLVTESDLLILDEPTNHLDIDAIAWLEDWLADYRGGLLLVTHDRHVLDRICTRVLELDRGAGYVHEGGYGAYLEGRARREEQAVQTEATRRVLAKQELAWLRRGAPARTRKPKARIEQATKIVEGSAPAAARANALDLGKLGATGSGAKGTVGWGVGGLQKRYPGTPRLGDRVIELEHVGHHWPDAPWLFRNVELLLDNRERLGVVGVNGSGKSTLLDVIAGRAMPVEGTVTAGPTVSLAYYDQRGAELDLTMTVRDAVAGPHRQPGPEESALLEAFWFESDAQRAPIGLLSGGERRRLQLVLTLAQRPNVLLLDEPTNDLDLDTLRSLEDYLEEWPGALIVVSHDRAFLERTVTDVIVLDGEGDASRRPGGYAAWEDERRARRTARRAPKVDRPKAAPQEAKPAAQSGERSPSTVRHQLKQVESAMTAAQRRRDKLQVALDELTTASPVDHHALAAAGEQLAAAVEEVDAAEHEWLELADELDRALEARAEERRRG